MVCRKPDQVFRGPTLSKTCTCKAMLRHMGSVESGSNLHLLLLQMYKEIAKAPEKLNKTRGIGSIAAPPELVAAVVADEYEAWDDSIKDLKTLTSERDPATGALVEICWTRYCLRESLVSRSPTIIAFQFIM